LLLLPANFGVDVDPTLLRFTVFAQINAAYHGYDK